LVIGYWLSCCAFKLEILDGVEAHPTRVLLIFDTQFKCRTAYWLFVIGYLLLVICDWLFVIGYTKTDLINRGANKECILRLISR